MGNTLRSLLKISALSLLILWPLLYLTTTINDDAFVYYTYAKNFARGNFFAYDPRGIPSEGFTSLLYMILLVPFEMIHLPLSLAALLINIVSILGAAFLSCKMFELLFPEQSRKSYLVGMGFLFSVYCDSNVRGLLGWGLETISNIPVFLGLIYSSLLVIKTGERKSFNSVLGLYALSVLVRPENLVLGGPWVLIGFSSLSSKREGVRSIIMFALMGAVFLLAKYLVFGDFVPTGYYRKMSGQPLNLNYLKEYLKEYSIVFHPVYWLGMLCLSAKSVSLSKNTMAKKTLVGLVLTLIALILFVLKIEPIQGYLQRYLTLGTIIVYLLASSLFALVIPTRKTVEACFILFVVVVLFSGFQQRYRINPLALYQESIAQMNQDTYVTLGRFLQAHVKNPQEVSLMFGDAGSIPYFFDSKFIDINGLTEPEIARMFKAKNRKEKVATYISNQKLDMAVLAVENSWINLSKDSQHLPQGPLKSPREYAHLLRKMRKDGFAYAGTIHAPSYDLHFGLNKHSENFADLKKVLLEYMGQGRGFVKDSDLRVEFSDGDVIFENIHRSRTPSPSEKEKEITRTL